eukprot:COSAG02_NODE_14843_length_1230_cov_1.435897_2_plen_354_part_01
MLLLLSTSALVSQLPAGAAETATRGMPVFLPSTGASRYIYSSRAAASKACEHVGKVLCSKGELLNYSMCEAGWCSDWEGYWMGSPCPAGCGSAGYNDWSGPAGAYCCTPPPPPPPPGSPGRPRVVGWYDTSKQYMSGFPIEDIDFSVRTPDPILLHCIGIPLDPCRVCVATQVVTHIVAGAGSVAANGTVSCNPAEQYADPIYAQLHRSVRANGAKLQWSYSAPPANILTNATNRANFLATVRDAVMVCDADGIEFDYEGPSSAEEADAFTTLLIEIKQAVCLGNSSCGFVISCDSEPPQWNDYHRLNASRMDGKNIDFVNYMCYFDATNDSDVSRWNESISMLLDQGYPPSTI